MEQMPDRKRVQEFARKLFGHYTSGMLTMMVDVGHKTGLFEAAAQGSGTSQQIADRAGLNERYVREWLSCMATGAIVEYDASSLTFLLPAEHAVCLTGTSSRNLAAGSQGLAMLAKRLSAVVDCFRSGGGVLTGTDATLWNQIGVALDANEGLETALLKHPPSDTLEEWIAHKTCELLMPKEREVMSAVLRGDRSLRTEAAR